jgi:hypothetical protein|uniref:Uncharacterized protein n=1 Tax=Podoviridae sp. ctdet19 TaxID=2825262 RepID=A0A8S5U7R5_9CAUD|nr:MAG TPA: hypothetical protein [Podoviridae sp. ctdet19]
MASYNDMAKTVLDFYTNPNDLVQYGGWETIFKPGNEYNLEQAYNAIRSNPNVQVLERTDGTIVGWWNKSTGSENIIRDIGSVSNSNTIGGTNQSTALTNIQTSPAVTQTASGSFTFANSPQTVSGKLLANGGVAPAIAAVATGLSLGVTIDRALYAAKPGFLSDEQLETLNPENWKQISSVVDEQWTAMGYPTIGKIGRKVFDTILGVDSTDNSTQMYIDEDAYAYMAWYLQHNNMFGTVGNNIDASNVDTSNMPHSASEYQLYSDSSGVIVQPRGNDIQIALSGVSGNPRFFVYQSGSVVSTSTFNVGVVSRSPFKFKVIESDSPNNPRYYNGISKKAFGINYYHFDWTYGRPNDISSTSIPFSTYNNGALYPDYGENTYSEAEILILDGKLGSYPQGIDHQSNATLPSLSTATDLESFKNLLKQQYPDNWTNSVTRQVLQPDGTLKTFTYVPVPTPNATNWMDTEPTGDGSQQSQKDTVVNPDMDTSIKDTISSSGSTGSDTPNPPDTGGGDSPTVVPPVGKTSSLWSIYNPTLEQVNQFGSWLWSSDFVEQLKKLFSDPMQAIIGLHKVYSPVQTTGQGTIKCGYLDSGVPSKLVSEQYVTVDCGSVDMQEYFGNVFDYPPYTEISIYLPFIGIRQLDPSDVMRSTISVKYHIDVLTGACLAEVNVQRDASGGTLYTFSGDAAVRYPVSSGSYMGIVSGLIGVATSIVSGNLLPALGGATRLHTNVDRSGSFTGNSGAMGSKVPYIIVSRPQTAMADKFETLSGYPSNTYTPLSACKGFTQVKYCHVENLSATETEKNEIERLLKEGVIL